MKKFKYRDALDDWMRKNAYDFRDVDYSTLSFIEFLEERDAANNAAKIRMKVSEEIHEKIKCSVVNNLKGVPDTRRTYDPFKFDYIIDNLESRIERITTELVDLAMDALWPKIAGNKA